MLEVSFVLSETFLLTLAESPPGQCEAPSQSSAKMAKVYRAIVVGATGATGRELVSKLVNKPNCLEVKVIVRRDIDPKVTFPAIGEAASKVSVVVSDLDKLSSLREHFVGCDVAFTCVGTSRVNDEVKTSMQSDGNDEGFRAWLEKVDLGYSKAFAEVAASAGVKHLSRVSASGADPNKEGGGFNIYGRYQGLADEAVFALVDKFSHGVTCFRPGALNRGEMAAARPHEVEYLKKVPSLEVGKLADALLIEWESALANPKSEARIVALSEIATMVGEDPSKFKA